MNKTLLAAIDTAAPAMEARLRAWADVNSGSHHATGLARMADLVAAEFFALGADVELVRLEGALAPAVRARKGSDSRAAARVLLSGHFDTVYGEEHAFQRCTRSETDADVLRGPGVADMKGGLVVMLEALRALETDAGTAARVAWEAIIVPDEEIGSPSSAPLLREAAARHDLGIVFEPALPNGEIVGSRKGVGIIRVTARGRAAHAGRDFAHGRNAIVALANFVSAAHFINRTIPDVIVNAGAISGGGTVNIVPDHAVAELNVRAMRAKDGDDAITRMRIIATEIQRASHVELQLDGGFSRPPMEETPASRALLDEWCTCARDLGAGISIGHSGGGSDGNDLAAAGLPVIDGAGVEGGELHSDREWMRVSSLARRAKIAALFLARLAAGEIAVRART